MRVLILLLLISSCNSHHNPSSDTPLNKNVMQTTTSDIYQFKVDGLEGDTISFSDFKGKKILIVNTASECGYTPQYAELEELYKNNKEKLVIIGFPANDFGGQEPGSDEEIKSFCQKNYGVTFPMASKITVKGEDMAPIYQWLTRKEKNGVMDAEVRWNFTKFLIDENGHLIAHFDTKVSPLSAEIKEKL